MAEGTRMSEMTEFVASLKLQLDQQQKVLEDLSQKINHLTEVVVNSQLRNWRRNAESETSRTQWFQIALGGM
jgi:uncharacterized coiled-coil protein SlyX